MKHRIYRNGRLYDQLDPETHAILPHVRQMANEMVGDTFSVKDHTGQTYYEVKVTINQEPNRP